MLEECNKEIWQVLQDINRIKGGIKKKVKQKIIEAVKITRTISRRHKKWILANLKK